MAKTYEGLRADANIIKNEIEAQKNTATRVGTMFVDVVEKVEEVSNALTTKMEDANARIDSVVEENTMALAYVVESLNNALAEKQKKLVSGENIKTINGESVLGSGDISTSLDVSALFVVGGKMQVASIDLLTHHLYVRTDNYISNVSVVVGNKEFILEARRRASMASYDTLGVKAIVTFADGEGLATCVNVIME